MESTPQHPILKVTQEEIEAIRKSCDLDIIKINKFLDAIEDWCKKESHLVDALPYLSRDILERFLIIGRGSVEQTKIIIDKALTIRGMLPEFLPKSPSIFLNEMDIFLNNVLVTLLPKPNPKDNTRIYIVKIINENFDDMATLINIIKLSCFILETRLHYDYNFSDRIIYDCKNLKANLIAQLNPVMLKKLEVMFVDVYKIKIKGLHGVNIPPFANTIMSILKKVYKEKITKRIHLHNSYEELHQEIPKEVLPVEYGGEEVSCSKLADQWKSYLKTDDARRLVENYSKMVSNESRRNDYRFNEEYLGMPGSFRLLNVD